MIVNGYIYVIKVVDLGESLYKIGMTNDFERRKGEFKNLLGKIEVIGVYQVSQTDHVEDILHEFFEDKRYKGIYHREIFELSKSDILICLKLIKALQSLEQRLGFRTQDQLLGNIAKDYL